MTVASSTGSAPVPSINLPPVIAVIPVSSGITLSFVPVRRRNQHPPLPQPILNTASRLADLAANGEAVHCFSGLIWLA
jgi:hypothetical protein